MISRFEGGGLSVLSLSRRPSPSGSGERLCRFSRDLLQMLLTEVWSFTIKQGDDGGGGLAALLFFAYPFQAFFYQSALKIDPFAFA